MKQPWLAIGILAAALAVGGGIVLMWEAPPDSSVSQTAPQAEPSIVSQAPVETEAEKNRRSDAMNAQVSRSLRFNQAEAKLVNDPTDRSTLSEDALLLDDPDITEDQAQAAVHSLLGFLRMLANGGDFPSGLNVEVTNALLGANSRKIAFLSMDCRRINENGELVDQHGTPYWFHSSPTRVLTITSAGPDKILHTADDVAYPPN